jgi:5-methyltetrahydrofolate--homocysteine methyltransferase
MDLLEQIADALQRGDEEKVDELTRKALEEGIAPKEVLDRGLVAGMNVVGELFRAHEIFLPDVLLSAKAMVAGIEQLKPFFIRDGFPTMGKIVIGTVRGDLHDIGKNLVAVMLKGASFEVVDLGKDVAPETFVETASREGAHVIGMSALLTTTMPAMRKVTELLRSRGLAGRIKTIIGGAPVTEAFAREIGADAYAFDAAKAVERVRELTREAS